MSKTRTNVHISTRPVMLFQCRRDSATRFPSLDSCDLYRARAVEGKTEYAVCLNCPGPEDYVPATHVMRCNRCGKDMPVVLNSRNRPYINCPECRARLKEANTRWREKQKAQEAQSAPARATDENAESAPGGKNLRDQAPPATPAAETSALLASLEEEKIITARRPEGKACRNIAVYLAEDVKAAPACRICGRPAADCHLLLRVRAGRCSLTEGFDLVVCSKWACVSKVYEGVTQALQGVV